ncbi:MAG TPA: FG-GAP repeat protein, partial [Polyangiales bacterium]|nr:FG-GAP repeat protein [Polyangiales bacterium]
YCSCRDDWDCPEYSHCTSGRCEGTGRSPHCFLPPTGFASLLPEDEPGFPWGGHDADGYTGTTANSALVHGSPVRSRDAAGHPFPRHAQVTSTPVVANLNDDNGDGLINELDLPELIFTSFCDTNYFNHGVLRAVHGGGANAGKELFARCGEKLWNEGDAIVDGEGAPLPAADCPCNGGDFEPTGAPAVGDLDGDGIPEIVVTAHAAGVGSSEVSNTRVMILNRRGEIISDKVVPALAGGNPAVTLANVDAQGLAEIIVGARVFLLEAQAGVLTIVRDLVGQESQGTNNNQGAVSCVADLDDDGRMEVVAGGTAYKVPAPPSGACPSELSGLNPEHMAYCTNTLQVMWNAEGVEGFCAIADVLAEREKAEDPEPLAGAGAPLDGVPEVVLIGDGTLRIYNGQTG